MYIDTTKNIKELISDYEKQIVLPLSDEVLKEKKQDLFGLLSIIPGIYGTDKDYEFKILDLLNKDIFTDKEKGYLYSFLGDYYFNIADIEKAELNYKKSLDNGFYGKYEEYIFIELLNKVLKEGSIESILLFDFEQDLENLPENIYISHIKQDLENLILNERGFIQKPLTIVDNIYNFELEYETIYQGILQGINMDILIINFKERIKNLEDSIKDSRNYSFYKPFFDNLYSMIENKSNINYNFYSVSNNKFLTYTFSLIDKYLDNNEDDNLNKVLSFILKHTKALSTHNIVYVLAMLKSITSNYKEKLMKYKDEILNAFSNILLPQDFFHFIIDLSYNLERYDLVFGYTTQYPEYANKYHKKILEILMEKEENKNDATKLADYYNRINNSNMLPQDIEYYKFLGKKLNVEIKIENANV